MSKKRESSFNSHLSKEFILSNRLKNNLSLRKFQVQQYIEKKRFNPNQEFNEMEIDNPYNILKCDPTRLTSSSNVYENLLNSNFDKSNLNEYELSLNSEDFDTQIKGIVGIRKLLSEPNDPPVKEIIMNGSVTKLLDTVKSIKEDKIICEIIWIFTNIASSDHIYTRFLHSNGIVEIISSLIQRNNSFYLKDQLIWLIANIAGDHEKYRTEMREKRFHEYLLDILTNETLWKIHKNCLWALSNILKGSKSLEISANLSHALVMCCKIINSYLNHTDYSHFKVDRIEDLIPNVLNIIACMTEYNSCLLTILIKYNLAAHLIEMIDYVKHDQLCYQTVLRILGNFSANEHVYTTEIVEKNILRNLKIVLEEKNPSNIIKEICWILSNIAAGLEEHVDMFYKEDGLVNILFKILKTESFDVKKEAIWCISNLTSTRDSREMNKLVHLGIIQCFSEWLNYNDFKLSALIIEALENILSCLIQKDHSRRKILTLCENFGIINKLENLAFGDNKILSLKSDYILDKYFLHYREVDDEDNIDFENQLIFCPEIEATEEIFSLSNSINNLENNKENYPDNDELAVPIKPYNLDNPLYI